MGIHWTPASIPILMPAKRYIVTLTENERTQLQALVHKGRAHAFRRRRWIIPAGRAAWTAPAGSSGWTLPRLADRLVALQVVESMGRETVRVVLQKTDGSLGKSVAGACRRSLTVILSALGKRSWIRTSAPWTPNIRSFVWTKSPRSCIRKCARAGRHSPVGPPGRTMRIDAWARPICS